MKRFLCILLVFSFLLVFVACDDASSLTDKVKDAVNDALQTTKAKTTVETTSATTAATTATTTAATTGGSSETPGGEQPGGEQPGNDSKVKLSGYLNELLSNYKCNPKSKIPDTMLPEYKSHVINKNSVVTDYSDFVDVSSITSHGFGEQWHMVLDNIDQSQIFFNTLAVVDTLTTTSVAIFNNFLDENPADTAHHTFKEGIYSVTINCTATHIYYVLDYTATLPVLGEQTVQIALSMDIASKVKDVRVQIGDANALKYTIEDGKYTFAIKYLDMENIDRTAHFSLEEDKDENITGHIYEYLTISKVETASVADFYITEDYVTVVGNKANGIVGFKNYICELYSADTGKLEGYEVRESLELAGIGVTLNTLWFDLDDISGINSIKYTPKTDNEDAKFFINGSSKALESKDFGGFILTEPRAKSRRFDIEFRTQYFYYYDSVEEKYVEIAVEVPMIFVQEEKYSDFVSDMKSTNGVTVSVEMSSSDLNKLMSDYDTLIDILVENKEKTSSTAIIDFIGQKKTFN